VDTVERCPRNARALLEVTSGVAPLRPHEHAADHGRIERGQRTPVTCNEIRVNVLR
jgi:hypothetical protein